MKPTCRKQVRLLIFGYKKHDKNSSLVIHTEPTAKANLTTSVTRADALRLSEKPSTPVIAVLITVVENSIKQGVKEL